MARQGSKEFKTFEIAQDDNFITVDGKVVTRISVGDDYRHWSACADASAERSGCPRQPEREDDAFVKTVIEAVVNNVRENGTEQEGTYVNSAVILITVDGERMAVWFDAIPKAIRVKHGVPVE